MLLNAIKAKPDVPTEWLSSWPPFFCPFFRLGGEPCCHVQFKILPGICHRNLASTLRSTELWFLEMDILVKEGRVCTATNMRYVGDGHLSERGRIRVSRESPLYPVVFQLQPLYILPRGDFLFPADEWVCSLCPLWNQWTHSTARPRSDTILFQVPSS